MSKKIKFFMMVNATFVKEINFYSKIDKDKNFDWVNIHNNNKKIKTLDYQKRTTFHSSHTK